MNNIILRVSDLVTQFGTKVIHNHLSLEVKRGELLLLMGSSGSGKSTLIDFIMDTDSNPIYKGQIYWNDEPWDKSDIVYKIGFGPQNGGFLRDYTVGQNIAMPLEYVAKFPHELALEIAWATMQILGLGAQVFHQYPHTLSGGMLRRASIARALVLNQELLILDEPLSGLDPMNCDRLVNLIHDLVPTKTIICVSHHFMKADRYAIMNKGELLIGSLNEIRRNEFGRDFMKGFPNK